MKGKERKDYSFVSVCELLEQKVIRRCLNWTILFFVSDSAPNRSLSKFLLRGRKHVASRLRTVLWC